MFRTFAYLVVVCYSTTPDTLSDDDDLPPPPPASLRRSDAYQSDPCTVLCREFRAGRQGNGFDLCDTNVESFCLSTGWMDTPRCAFLYWSTTEDGAPGLVYSLNGTDVSETERDSPVTCQAAGRIVFGLPI